MKVYPECIPCLLKQGLTTLQLATGDTDLQIQGLKEIIKLMPSLLELPTPPHIGRVIHNLPKVITENPDPYSKVKKEYTNIALNLYPTLKEKVRSSKDPLLTAIKISAVGNTIDFARGFDFDLIKEIEVSLEKEFAINDYEEFKIDIHKIDKILYLADNAGETVFDRVLIEEINEEFGDRKVLYAVRSVPVINDATRQDAIDAGIANVAEIIDSGTDAPSAIPEYCSAEFRELFFKSQLILSKGQGNYEGISEIRIPIYFLFKIKCPPLAQAFDLEVGDLVFIKKK